MIQVGEYVRTKNGEIAKIIEVNNYNERLFLVYEDNRVETDYTLDRLVYCDSDYFDHFIPEEIIIKHSFNIIDLIEVGDYVNGYKITCIDEKGYKYREKCVVSEAYYNDSDTDFLNKTLNEARHAIATLKALADVDYINRIKEYSQQCNET